MSEWKISKLCEIVEINPRETIKKGTISKKIGMDKIKPFYRDIDEYEITEFSGGTKVRNGDTLMARITPCLENGKIAKVNILDEGEVGFGSTEYIVFRAKNGINEDFVFYLINSAQVREAAIKSMVGSSGRQRVQTDVVKNIEINVPPYTEQIKIAHILKKIDDKIKLNNEMNINLFELSNTLFMQYLFKDKANLTYTTLDKISDVKGGKRLPKGTTLISEPNTHPYIRVRDLNDTIFVVKTSDFEYVDDETQKTIERYIVNNGDVLISIVGTIGLTAIVDSSLNNANLTENCVKLINLQGISPEYLLLFLRSKQGQAEMIRGTVGAVQAKLPIKNIQSIRIPILSKEEMESLEDKLKSIFGKIGFNTSESIKLRNIRDVLLPRLISGEIDISKIDI